MLKVIILLATLIAGAVSAETRLMMVEEEGCPWCKRWNHDIGGEYDITDEGKIAPLMRYDLTEPLPEGISLASAPHYTPTFILLVDGQEVNRLEGYPGEGFFWGILGKMLAELPENGIEELEEPSGS